ncbi:MAG TPA: hypothetical protein VGG27_14970 [Magnetospirillaceae bacterium]|jgi:hypothetical protein
MPSKPKSAQRRSDGAATQNSENPLSSEIVKPRCGAPTVVGTPCKNSPVMGGRCRLHVDLSDDLEALRFLQEAAERHAFEADHAIEGGENGDKDAAFNRNARTAAALARVRRVLATQDAKRKEMSGGDREIPQIDVPPNNRGDAPPKTEPDETS